MIKLTKKFVAVIISILLFGTTFASVSAYTITKNSEDYFIFTGSKQRMDSNGDFDFYFHKELKSSDFVANGTSLSVNTCAKLVDSSGSISYDKNEQFRVSLWKKGVVSYAVGYYICNADGIYGGKTFTGITKGATYFLEFIPVDDTFGQGGYYFSGYGDVSPVTVK